MTVSVTAILILACTTEVAKQKTGARTKMHLQGRMRIVVSGRTCHTAAQLKESAP